MFNANVWKDIQDAGLRRAQLINDCYKFWDAHIDNKCNELHTNLALNIKQQYPELEGFSLDYVKLAIEQCSDDYVVPEAKTHIGM